jgi:hypothetical protein
VVRRLVPMTDDFQGEKFFVRRPESSSRRRSSLLSSSSGRRTGSSRWTPFRPSSPLLPVTSLCGARTPSRCLV